MDHNEQMLHVSDECVRLGLVVAAIVLRRLTVADSPSMLREAICDAAGRVRRRFSNTAVIRNVPEVDALRQIYRTVGANPNRDVPACQRLLEFTWKRGDLPRVNTVVDMYNLISVECLLSLGAHDLETIDLPIQLTVARAEESFMPLGSAAPSTVKRGEFAYFDARSRVLCRLDVVQADFSRITERTSAAVVIVQGTAANGPGAFTTAARMLGELTAQYCGGSAETVVWPF